MNTTLVVIGVLAIIFYFILRTPIMKRSVLRTCDPCIRRAKNREVANLRNKDPEFFVHTDLEKKDSASVNIPAKKRQYVERQVELKVIKYLIAPLEILCLILFLVGIYQLVAYLSHSVEAFLVLVLLSFSMLLCGAIDIENDIMSHEESLNSVKNMKMHKEDVK